MARFIFIPRDIPQDFSDVSPEEMQKIIEQYIAWGDKLDAAGKKKGGDKLRDGEGRVLRGENGNLTITDGPFSETKEVVGGYWLIEAEDYDDAVELASDCPHIQYGASLEIRACEEM